jgi:hypothetical protein
MPTWLRIVVGAFAVLGVGYTGLFLFAWISTTPENSCRVSTAMVLPSPTASLFVRLETEQCGTDKPMQTVVWLSRDRSTRMGSKSWSVFRAQSAQPLTAGAYQPLQLQVAWLSESSLRITYPKGITAELRSSTPIGDTGVTVIYTEGASTGP